MQQATLLPEWQVSQWFNAPAPLSLAGLRGKIVVIEAFQMLCPGCVAHGIPQAQKVAQIFNANEVQVVGLHTVFEHHAGMGPASLEAFLHEYRISFPVGIDMAGEAGDPIPKTMRAYRLQGTPSLLLVDRHGRLRKQKLGQEQDMQLGAEIMSLLREG